MVEKNEDVSSGVPVMVVPGKLAVMAVRTPVCSGLNKLPIPPRAVSKVPILIAEAAEALHR
jgi:hypothetical protein